MKKDLVKQIAASVKYGKNVGLKKSPYKMILTI
jgi:hypothetical protein